MYHCKNCNQIFDKKNHFDRHKDTLSCQKNIDCLMFHKIKIPEDPVFQCSFCPKKYKNKTWFKKHIKECFSKNNLEKDKKIQNNINITNQHITNNQIINNNNLTNNNLIVNIKLPFTPLSEMKNVISKEEFLNILNYENVDRVIQELVRLTYFSKKNPENNYWCVSFPTQKFGALQYNHKTENIERWLTEEVVDHHFEGMMFCICPVMDDLYQKEIYSTLNAVQKRNLNILYNYFGIKNLSSKYPNDYEKIKMVAYNNKHIPISFWKKLKFENRLDLSNNIPIQLDY